jgi:hypothetical protein
MPALTMHTVVVSTNTRIMYVSFRTNWSEITNEQDADENRITAPQTSSLISRGFRIVNCLFTNVQCSQVSRYSVKSYTATLSRQDGSLRIPHHRAKVAVFRSPTPVTLLAYTFVSLRGFTVSTHFLPTMQ